MNKKAPASSRAAAGSARRDAAASREGLIAAAIAEFARNGFAGARVDEIAQSAGVNKQLVYHYFGSKQGLYLAALESVYVEIREKERRLSLGELEPMEAMAQLVGFSFDYLAEHPEFIALLADENRNQGAHVLESDQVAQDAHAGHRHGRRDAEAAAFAPASSATISTPSISTSRSPAFPTSSSPTTTPCRPSSAASSVPVPRWRGGGAM